MCPDPNKAFVLDAAYRDDPRCYDALPSCEPAKGINPDNPKCYAPGILWPATWFDTDPDGKFTKLYLSRGTVDHIEKGWTGYIVDDEGNKIAGSDFTIILVKNESSVARTSLFSRAPF